MAPSLPAPPGDVLALLTLILRFCGDGDGDPVGRADGAMESGTGAVSSCGLLDAPERRSFVISRMAFASMRETTSSAYAPICSQPTSGARNSESSEGSAAIVLVHCLRALLACTAHALLVRLRWIYGAHTFPSSSRKTLDVLNAT